MSSASLERALPAALQMLRPGGRLAVVSFHSLEDRIVKRFMRVRSTGARARPTSRSAHAARSRRSGRPAARDPPERDEVPRNPRAQSARLRVAGDDWLAGSVRRRRRRRAGAAHPPNGGATPVRRRGHAREAASSGSPSVPSCSRASSSSTSRCCASTSTSTSRAASARGFGPRTRRCSRRSRPRSPRRACRRAPVGS